MENNKIQFAFFGTPDLSVTVLNELEEASLLPSVIVTKPDKPRGRGQQVQPPPVKVWADKHGIPILQPEKIDDSFLNTLADYGSFDVFVVAAYGKILPKRLIEMPEHGSVNMHPSLLPQQRGAAPIRGAILEEDETGVTIMLIDEELDHGPIIAQEKIVEWSPESGGPPEAAELEDILAHAGGRLLARVLPDWVAGDINAKPQDHKHATYTGKFKKSDGEIDLSDDPYMNFRKIQAFHRWPRAFFFAEDGTRVIISDASFKDEELIIENVIPEGEDEMKYETFTARFDTDA